MGFIEDLILMIAKENMPLFVVESPWLRQMVLCLCGQVKFPFRKQLVCEHIPALLQITMATYVFLAIVQYAIVTTIFDLRMLRSRYDIFA